MNVSHVGNSSARGHPLLIIIKLILKRSP
jgi:hypothetical protein